MSYILKTPPAEFPVTLLEAKAHIGQLLDIDDTLITSLITVATEQAEEITQRQLVSATYELYMPTLCERFELPKPPLVSVDSIEYIADGDTAYSTLDAALYMVSRVSEPALVARHPNAMYPNVSDILNPVRVTFTCGYGTAADVPQSIKQWMLMRIATLYEQREEMVIGTIAPQIQNSYNDYLITKYRVSWL